MCGIHRNSVELKLMFSAIMALKRKFLTLKENVEIIETATKVQCSVRKLAERFVFN